MRVAVLGHTGMLGHMVVKYLKHKKLEILTTDFRWPSEEFKDFIINLNADFLINCIGCIPQKNSDWQLYKSINILLPRFLSDNFKCKIIHPTTDCEFDGQISIDNFYFKNDIANSLNDYGISKAYSSAILKDKINVKQIRTSIVGPELKSKVSLMEWFLKQQKDVNGYTNHYWNGITTLEWAKQCYNIIINWDKNPNLIQLGSEKISKYQLLCLINIIFNCQKNIIPKKSYISNKCLLSDFEIINLQEQLKELKFFYYTNNNEPR